MFLVFLDFGSRSHRFGRYEGPTSRLDHTDLSTPMLVSFQLECGFWLDSSRFLFASALYWMKAAPISSNHLSGCFAGLAREGGCQAVRPEDRHLQSDADRTQAGGRRPGEPPHLVLSKVFRNSDPFETKAGLWRFQYACRGQLEEQLVLYSS